MYIYIYIYIGMYIHTRTHTHIYIYIYTYVYIYIYTYTPVYQRERETHTHTYIYIYMCVYIYIYIYKFVHVWCKYTTYLRVFPYLFHLFVGLAIRVTSVPQEVGTECVLVGRGSAIVLAAGHQLDVFNFHQRITFGHQTWHWETHNKCRFEWKTHTVNGRFSIAPGGGWYSYEKRFQKID